MSHYDRPLRLQPRLNIAQKRASQIAKSTRPFVYYKEPQPDIHRLVWMSIIGVVVFIITIVLIYIFLIRKKKNKEEEENI